ncbi:MAG: hypothetical protein AAB393_18975, partial [Bacteroidota bacterium]
DIEKVEISLSIMYSNRFIQLVRRGIYVSNSAVYHRITTATTNSANCSNSVPHCCCGIHA